MQHVTSARFSGVSVVAAAACVVLLAPSAHAAGSGKVVTEFAGGGAAAFDVVVQPDGRTVAAGTAGSAIALTRYNTDGSLDPTFGTGGRVTTTIATFAARANAVVVLGDGRILAAGTRTQTARTDPTRPPRLVAADFVLARYAANGTLDPSFGSGGIVVTEFAPGSFDFADDLAVQSDGRIVVAGEAAGDFALARYTADGTLDATFGTGGKVTTDFAGRGGDEATGVVVQPNGRIVAAGFAIRPTTNTDFGVARYNADGTLDTTFGSGGRVATNLGEVTDNGLTTEDQAADVVVQPDGRVVLVGSAGVHEFALVRYTAAGALDGTFGRGGVVRTDVVTDGFLGGTDRAFGAAPQPDGKIIAAGWSGDDDFALVRYTANGALDGGFGAGGKVLTKFSQSGSNRADAVTVLGDGRIVGAGNTWPGSAPTNFALARYTAAGVLDPTFG